MFVFIIRFHYHIRTLLIISSFVKKTRSLFNVNESNYLNEEVEKYTNIQADGVKTW